MRIQHARRLAGEIALPGDKSISHRAVMLTSLASGDSQILNFSKSLDCTSTLECLRSLGVEIREIENGILVRGVGKMGLAAPRHDLDCGNSGTTMRLLAGILAGQNFDAVLKGDDSLNRRPMERVVGPLSAMGAAIRSTNGCAPLSIRGRHPLQPIRHVLAIASAQVKSSILHAGLYADGPTSICEPVPTRDHTERMLRSLGVEIDIGAIDGEMIITMIPPNELTAKTIQVPSDISSAAFFVVAGACLEGSHLTIRDVGLNPTRTGIVEVLRRLGAAIEITHADDPECPEPFGEIRVCGGLEPPQDRVVIRGDLVAGVIDEIPILGVLGTQIPGGLEVRDAAELRVKETDRIRALVSNLRRMGSEVEERTDGFLVARSRLKGAVVDSFGDHRMAMAFAVAGLFAEGETEIVGADRAAVSFPGFFEVLENVVVR